MQRRVGRNVDMKYSCLHEFQVPFAALKFVLHYENQSKRTEPATFGSPFFKAASKRVQRVLAHYAEREQTRETLAVSQRRVERNVKMKYSCKHEFQVPFAALKLLSKLKGVSI